MEHDIKVICKVDDEFLSDILTTAAEGGINYWCEILRYETGDNPAYTKIVIQEEDEEERTLDIQVILKGIQKMLDTPPANKSTSTMVATYYQLYGWLLDAVKNPEVDNVMIDADVADAIVQFGLFEEQRYG